MLKFLDYLDYLGHIGHKGARHHAYHGREAETIEIHKISEYNKSYWEVEYKITCSKCNHTVYPSRLLPKQFHRLGSGFTKDTIRQAAIKEMDHFDSYTKVHTRHPKQ